MIKQAILSLNHVTKNFLQGDSLITVLHDISYTFSTTHSYAIIGASGSGKSTLMQLLSGLDTPTQGQVLCNDVSIDDFSQEERAYFLNSTVGLVFQEALLVDELSVIENVMLKGLIVNRSYKECEQEAMALLDSVGLRDKAHEHPRSLSGGQQQRVAIMRALFNKPRFLLADEPTGNLDAHTGKNIITLLQEYYNQWGVGLIISSHDPHVAEQVDTVVELHSGRLAER